MLLEVGFEGILGGGGRVGFNPVLHGGALDVGVGGIADTEDSEVTSRFGSPGGGIAETEVVSKSDVFSFIAALLSRWTSDTCDAIEVVAGNAVDDGLFGRGAGVGRAGLLTSAQTGAGCCSFKETDD